MHNPNSQHSDERHTHYLRLKMFIAYEDRAAWVRTKNLQYELVRRCEAQITIDNTSWNFALLANPHLREQAASEAADSDLVIISTRATSGLPANVESWLAEWLTLKQGNHVGLVALVDPQSQTDGQLPFVAIALRELAEKAGIAFFCNLAPTHHPIESKSPECRTRGQISKLLSPLMPVGPRPIPVGETNRIYKRTCDRWQRPAFKS